MTKEYNQSQILSHLSQIVPFTYLYEIGPQITPLINYPAEIFGSYGSSRSNGRGESELHF